MRPHRASLLLASCAALTGLAQAGTDIIGIPSDCRVTVTELPSRGDGGARTLASHSGHWSAQGALVSPDGQRIASIDGEAVTIIERDGSSRRHPLVVFSTHLEWSQDSRHLALVTLSPEGHDTLVAIACDEGELLAQTVFKAREGVLIRDFCWSASSPSLIANICRVTVEPLVSELRSFHLPSGARRTLVELEDVIDFVATPFGCASAPTSAPGLAPVLVFGTRRGIFWLPEAGGDPQVLTEAPAVRCRNLTWGAGGAQLALDMVGQRQGDSAELLVFDLSGGAPRPSVIRDLPRIHTLWYSPDGETLTWASTEGIGMRRVVGEEERILRLPAPAAEDGTALEVKGCAWSPDSRTLAFTAGPELWLYDLATKGQRRIASFGRPLSHFLADPQWRGDKVIVTVFEDIELTEGAPAPKGERELEEERRRKEAALPRLY